MGSTSPQAPQLCWGQPLVHGSDGTSCVHPITASAAANWESLGLRASLENTQAQFREGIPDRDRASRAGLAPACREWESSWPGRSGWSPCSLQWSISPSTNQGRTVLDTTSSLPLTAALATRALGWCKFTLKMPQGTLPQVSMLSPCMSAMPGEEGAAAVAEPRWLCPPRSGRSRCCSESNTAANCAGDDPLCSQGNRRLCFLGILHFRGNSTT